MVDKYLNIGRNFIYFLTIFTSDNLMPPIPVQIAIQGGGAKLVLLLAVAQAIQELEKEGIIKVTRIAGTSAGAIVGALIACGESIEVVVERVKGMPVHELKQAFPRPSAIGVLRCLIWGTPLWSEDNLRKILKRLFESTATKTLAEIRQERGVDLYIVAANVTDNNAVVYGPQDDTHPVVSVLSDSCAIPFAIRTWAGNGNLVVDGGICENLPSDVLHDGNQDDFGPIVGISFTQTGQIKRPASASQFALALLETAIQNSMDRARRRLEKCFVIDPGDITTFDFEKAHGNGFRHSYRPLLNLSRAYFKELASAPPSRQIIGGEAWKRQAIESMIAFGRVYLSHRPYSKIRYSKVSLVGQALSLENQENADIVRYQAEFFVGGIL